MIDPKLQAGVEFQLEKQGGLSEELKSRTGALAGLGIGATIGSLIAGKSSNLTDEELNEIVYTDLLDRGTDPKTVSQEDLLAMRDKARDADRLDRRISGASTGAGLGAITGWAAHMLLASRGIQFNKNSSARTDIGITGYLQGYLPKEKQADKGQDIADVLGAWQHAYVAGLPAAHASLRSGEIVRDRPDASKVNKLVASANRMAGRKGKAHSARQAESRAARWNSDWPKLVPGTPGELLQLLVSAPIDIHSAFAKNPEEQKLVAKRYAALIKKYQDKVEEEGEITTRETPWHVLMQGNLARLDSLIAGNKYLRKEQPKQYWLNPWSFSGPLQEAVLRMNRRDMAGTAKSDSTRGRAFGTIPIISTFRGGSEAQQKLRRAAVLNNMYADYAMPEKEDTDTDTEKKASSARTGTGIAGYMQGYLPKTAAQKSRAEQELTEDTPEDLALDKWLEEIADRLRNPNEALKADRKAAEQGDARAQFKLGEMYDNGEGVPQDYAEAMKWWRKAAEQGVPEAQHNLGVMYDNGRGVPQDYAEAMQWYRKAAKQGHAPAQSNIGYMYSHGEGVPQDKAEAMKWYRKASEQGIILGNDFSSQNLDNMRGPGESQQNLKSMLSRPGRVRYGKDEDPITVSYGEAPEETESEEFPQVTWPGEADSKDR